MRYWLQVAGGGFKAVDDQKLHVWQSAPISTPAMSGWAIGVTNYSSVQRKITYYATCLRSE